MRHRSFVLAIGLWAASAAGAVRAQGPDVAPRHEDGRPAGPPDYRVVFWYRRGDPLNTFRHQAYDVRKGQYPARAVDDWVRTLKRDFPDYEAYVKDVRLDRAGGQSDERQLATLILRENLEKGGPYGGYGLRDPYGIYGGFGLRDLLAPHDVAASRGISSREEVGAYSRGYGFLRSPGANRPPSFLIPPSPWGWQGPGSITGPFPYPYVRPRP